MVSLNKKSSLKKILKFYKAHILLYIAFTSLLIIKAILSFFSAFFIAKIISAMMNGNFDEAIRFALLDLVVSSFSCLLSCLNTYFYKSLENKVRFDIQQNVIQTALNIKMSYYDQTSSGIIVTRLTSDIDRISERFKSLTEKLVNILRRVSYLFYIYVLNLKAGIIVTISVLAIFAMYGIRIHYLSKLKPIVKQKKEKVNSSIIETIRAIKDIKTLNCEENIMHFIADIQNDFIETDNREYYIGITLDKLSTFVTHICDFVFIILNAYLLKSGEITASVFYTCYLYKDHTFNLATELGDLKYKLAECEICADRLIVLLEPCEEDMDKYSTSTIDNFLGDIHFENVRFSYCDDIPVLKGITFDIKPKETIALVGESGSGKSTIANLIGHLYYKDTGIIKFGDEKIENLSKEFIREHVVIINQFPYLFNLSIRENFKMVNAQISDDEIIKLCEKVELDSFIKSLPSGLDSIIGEGGCQLSGGQRQKLCIARALSRDVKVMIFDEATSSLDNASQDEIMKIIHQLSKKMTVIIIAHRLSTITYADTILVIENGKIVGCGKHEDLLKNNNYYRSLYLRSNVIS